MEFSEGNGATTAHPGRSKRVDEAEEYSKTAIAVAAEAGNTAVAKVLLSANAPLDVQNDKGETTLFIVAAKGHIAIVEALVAKLDLCNEGAVTALGAAGLAGHTSVTMLLTSAKTAEQ